MDTDSDEMVSDSNCCWRDITGCYPISQEAESLLFSPGRRRPGRCGSNQAEGSMAGIWV